jgi:hypothetical protein
VRKEVVIDHQGLILALGPHPDDIAADDEEAPQYLGYEALDGQQVHVVEIPRRHIHRGASQDALDPSHPGHGRRGSARADAV